MILSQGIDRSCVPSQRSKRLPQLFTEERDATTGAIHSKETQRFFPPASSNQTEYHIIKFYNFSSALVKNIMEAHHVKVRSLTLLTITMIRVSLNVTSPYLWPSKCNIRFCRKRVVKQDGMGPGSGNVYSQLH